MPRTIAPPARDIVKKWQGAIVNVRVVLKMRVSVGGREMQSMDESVETVGTVIDPSGLTVLSLGALNPGAMMNKMMGGGGSGQERMEFGSEPSDVKLRLADGKELPARIVLRDEDLDLAFLRPTSKPDKPLVAIDLADEGRPAMLDTVVVLSRLGRVGGWTPAASLQTIGAIIERPRTFYVIETGSASGVGTPAFTTRRKSRRPADDAVGAVRQAGHVLDGRRQRRRRTAAGHPAGGGRARHRTAGAGEITRPLPEAGVSSAGSPSPPAPCWSRWRLPPPPAREPRRCAASSSTRWRSASTARCELQFFSVDLFPTVTVRGEGLSVRLRGHDDVPPLFKIRSFTITGGLFGLLSRPRRFTSIALDGLEINIPPGGPDFKRALQPRRQSRTRPISRRRRPSTSSGSNRRTRFCASSRGAPGRNRASS